LTRAPTDLLVDLSHRDISSDVIDSVLISLQEGKEGEDLFAEVRILMSQQAALEKRALLDSRWRVETVRPVIESANLSLATAAHTRADLLVLDGIAAPDASSLLALQRVLDRDPYFAFTEPRISSYGQHLVEKLDAELGDAELASIPRSVIDSSPEFLIIPDHVSAALLIRENVVRDFAPLDESFATLRGAMRELIARARRVGFRCVVANRARVAAPRHVEAPNAGWQADMTRIEQDFPEVLRIEEAWRKHPVHEHEALLGRAGSFSSELRQTMIVDLTDMGAIRNGTTESIVATLRGIQAARSAWKISLLVAPEVVAYHRLREEFPEFAMEWPERGRHFTVAFRPVQPWTVASQALLHRLALFNFYFVHDSISDDIFIESPIHLADSWTFLAQNADGILYNSQFTRERFNLRFPVASRVEECVCLHSLSPADYWNPQYARDPGEHIYVVGNSYPHKWIRQTVTHLAAAFPYQKLKALGYEDPAIAQLEGVASGHVPEAEVEALYGEARVIVYPSQYEGFGLPVVRGLGYGKDIIARKSKLLTEIADHYRGPGRLIEFDSTQGLVEAVGRVLHGLPIDALPLGRSLGPDQAPRSWNDVGRTILDFVENRSRKPDASNWEQRQSLIEGMEAYTAVQRHWGLV
jgi:glycosyltransferase involved in cell wall biosynthesis